REYCSVIASCVTNLDLNIKRGDRIAKDCSGMRLLGCKRSKRRPALSQDNAEYARSAPNLSLWMPSLAVTSLFTLLYIPYNLSVRSGPSPQNRCPPEDCCRKLVRLNSYCASNVSTLPLPLLHACPILK